MDGTGCLWRICTISSLFSFLPQRDGIVSDLSQVFALSLGNVFISQVMASDLPRGSPADPLPSCVSAVSLALALLLALLQ